MVSDKFVGTAKADFFYIENDIFSLYFEYYFLAGNNNSAGSQRESCQLEQVLEMGCFPLGTIFFSPPVLYTKP